MPLIPSDSPNLPPLFDETSPTSLAGTNVFTSICNVSDAKRKKKTTTLHSPTRSNVQETAKDVREILKFVSKRRLFAPHFSVQ